MTGKKIERGGSSGSRDRENTLGSPHGGGGQGGQGSLQQTFWLLRSVARSSQGPTLAVTALRCYS